MGRSPTARFYAIDGRDEAQAYLDHPVLGARLLECTQAMLSHAGELAPVDILGLVDAQKFNSSMTPTFVMFDGAGDELWRSVGQLNPEQVRDSMMD